LSCIALSLAVYAVVSLQWYLIGYSLTFSPTASSFIGNFKHFGFIDVLEKPIASIPNATVPPLVFAIYQ
jgi:Amt family ammonium transporter